MLSCYSSGDKLFNCVVVNFINQIIEIFFFSFSWIRSQATLSCCSYTSEDPLLSALKCIGLSLVSFAYCTKFMKLGTQVRNFSRISAAASPVSRHPTDEPPDVPSRSPRMLSSSQLGLPIVRKRKRVRANIRVERVLPSRSPHQTIDIVC